jgi:hypothetical protein
METVQNDSQLTRLQALRNELAAMTPAQRGFVKGDITEDTLLFADGPATRSQLREQERRLVATFESRLNDTKHKVEVHDIDLSAQARSIDTLAARVRRLENGAPIAEIAVAGLLVVAFTSLIVAVASAAAEPA